MSEYIDWFDELYTQKAVEFEKKFHEKSNPIDNSFSTYEKLKTLGKGAFGIVLLVKQNDQLYAAKLLKKDQLISSKLVPNAYMEKKLLMSLTNPFIVSMPDFYMDNSYLYFIMEFLIGGDLFSLLKTMKRFTEQMVRFYGAQVLLALEYLHYLNILYRDLKPENLMICSDGYLKVIDMGFGKIVPRDKRASTFCGTPDYMAPEIIMHKGYHKAVDYWALGVLLYELTCGYPPFTHRDQLKIFEKIISGKFKMNAMISTELKELCKGLIVVDLTRRLGNLKRGALDIKDHIYFKELNWIELYEKKVASPYKPHIISIDDTSNFEEIKDEKIKIADKDAFEKEFAHFK